MMEPKDLEENGWREWGKYVLQELKRQGKVQEQMLQCVVGLKTEVAGLKVKAGVWGLIAGCIPVAIMITFLIAKGVMK